jgi:hypothetical protein
LPMHLLTLVLVALSRFSILPNSSKQCYPSLSVESTRRPLCSLPVTWRHWHSSRSDVRGFPGCILLGVRASHYNIINVCLYTCLNYLVSTSHQFCTILYCLWPIWLYHIFSHYLIKGMIFGKKLLNIKCVFSFSVQLLYETFHILRRIQWTVVINVHRCSCIYSTHYSCQTWIFLTDFLKILKYQISLTSIWWELVWITSLNTACHIISYSLFFLLLLQNTKVALVILTIRVFWPLTHFCIGAYCWYTLLTPPQQTHTHTHTHTHTCAWTMW